MLMKTGRLEEGREYLKSHKDEIYKFNSIEQVKRAEARYSGLPEAVVAKGSKMQLF